MINGDNDIAMFLHELSDLELMQLRKLATNKASPHARDFETIAIIAAEYVRRGYGVTGLSHLDLPDRGHFASSRLKARQ